MVGSKQLGGSLITYVAEAVQPDPSVAVTVYVPADNAVVSALFKSKVTFPAGGTGLPSFSAVAIFKLKSDRQNILIL